MAINSLEYASKFTGELDKVFVQEAVTGMFTDNALRAKFVGAKTVLVPNMDLVGLLNYDRDGGFITGSIKVEQQSYEMTMDRGRSFQLDREDYDETGIASLSSEVMGEFVRTQVVPECDAYVLSKLAKTALDGTNQTVAWDAAKPYAVFSQLKAKARNVVGEGEQLVCFIDFDTMSLLENSPEIARTITTSDFKKGEVNLKVKSIDGIALIPVGTGRMKTEIEVYTTEDQNDGKGGYAPTADAQNIRMLMLPKKAASLVKKSEKVRIFTPEQNLQADAYKFDYRLYYDVFVKKSKLGAIFASVEA